MPEMLYEELRQSEKEILQSLQKKDEHHYLTPILVDELADIRSALKKVEDGNFGLCEISGEIIPINLINQIPTIKTVNDVSHLESFYRKPILYHSCLSLH